LTSSLSQVQRDLDVIKELSPSIYYEFLRYWDSMSPEDISKYRKHLQEIEASEVTTQSSGFKPISLGEELTK
jgi:hypothetical protein